MGHIIRKAKLEDREAVDHLIALSARELNQEDYSQQQIERAISTIFSVDTDLILDGTYFVAESDGVLIGCGGWSKRKTLFGGDRFANRDSTELDPRTEPARIRAFFVHPSCSRKGIGRSILTLCEREARTYGFRSLELMATITGLKLYKACGYEGSERIKYDIGNDVMMELVPMRKNLWE
jgi:GNAT superfamily N-acetyltransferase